MTDNTDKKAKLIRGIVVSDKMNKSIVVKVIRKVKHALYGKYINKTTKYHVHDEGNTAQIGDTVLITSSRPISKMKQWSLVEVVERPVGS